MSKRMRRVLAYTYSFAISLVFWTQSATAAITDPSQGIVTALLTPLTIYFLSRTIREYTRLRRDQALHPDPSTPLAARLALPSTLFLFGLAILLSAARAAATAALAQGGV